MKNYVIDTSFWISYFNQSDSNHTKAIAIFEDINLNNDNIFINSHVVDEFFTLWVYKLWYDFVKMWWSFIENELNIKILEIETNNIIKSFFYLHKKISFTDISVILLSINTWSKLITFDKQQYNIYKKYNNNI